jgi:hypothetical protein
MLDGAQNVGRSRPRKITPHLIEAEAYRRVMAGETPATLDEFAQQLLHWLRQSYPEAAPTTLATVENQIRETWHRRHDMIQGGGL